MPDDLKPCPRKNCRGRPTVYPFERYGGRIQYWTFCSECGPAEIDAASFDNKKESVDWWNTYASTGKFPED